MGRLTEAVIAAFQMLTRIPTPPAPRAPDARTMALSALFYPWVGLLLGALGWLLFQGAAPLLGPQLAALAVLALWALLTGALHEDGLADVADAFGSQRDKDGLLRVMKDSRIGAYGALALMLATLARWTLLTDAAGSLAALLVSQSLPRAGIVLLAAWAGSATEGTGAALVRGLRWGHVFAACVPPTALLAYLAPPAVAAQGLAAALLLVGGAAVYFRARLGGVTGDCLGAAVLLQEIAVLAVLRNTLI